MTVRAGHTALVFFTVNHFTKHRQSDGLAVWRGNQYVFELFYLVELSHQAQGNFVLSLRDVS